MSPTLVPVVFGLTAAFLFALAAYYQQRAARTAHPAGETVFTSAVALMATLVRNRVWLLGWAVNLAGFAAQAIGLHLGSVAEVQPLLATQLLFALPMSSRERRRWPGWRDWLSALAICVGLVVLLVGVRAAPLQGQADRSRIAITAIGVLIAIVVLVPLSRGWSALMTSIVSAVGAGLCFAMTAVFIKLTTDDLLDHGVGYTASDWVGYSLAVSTGLGLVLEQIAFANGPLPWAVATKESVNPVASYALGVLAFPVALRTDPGTLTGISVSGALLVLGAIGLAHSPSADLWIRSDNAAVTPTPD